MSVLIPSQKLEQIIASLFKAVGSSNEEANQVAANLVLANLSGHDSHGVGMAPRYVDAVLEKNLIPNATIKVNTDCGFMLGVDGQQGFGQNVGVQAMELAFERVKKHGSCIMTLSNAHHLGRIGYFAEMAVAQNWVSIHFVSVNSRPIVAPFGGSDGRFGTNPCCIGIPLGIGAQSKEPFILDFATSKVAQGKMRVAHNEGRCVEPNTLIDEYGNPTQDPSVVVIPQSNGKMGALLPFGQHKGFGIAVACELLGGALSGGGTWHRQADGRRAVFNSMLTIVIDPQKLGTQESFASESLAFVDWLKSSPAAPDSLDDELSGVNLAGEPERAKRAKRLKEGVPIDEATWAEIVQSGTKVGVSI
jgi:uncharacterized oxidoreductase